MPSGGSEVLDLFTLVRSLFGGTLDVSFSGGYINAITIENLSGSGEMRIGGSGASPFDEPFGGATGIPIPPNSAIGFSNVLLGWLVDSTKRHIQILDAGGNGLSYEIGIIGRV